MKNIFTKLLYRIKVCRDNKTTSVEDNPPGSKDFYHGNLLVHLVGDGSIVIQTQGHKPLLVIPIDPEAVKIMHSDNYSTCKFKVADLTPVLGTLK